MSSKRTQAIIAEAVSGAFREAFNASLDAAAREAPESTLDETVRAFLQAWHREARNREESWAEQLRERLQ